MFMISGINLERFSMSLVYSLLAVFALGLISFLIWLILSDWQYKSFPVGLFTLAGGGLLLLISGCIGPGRFQREYDIVLYTPEPGNSFSTEIPVSGFSINDSITSADVLINGKKVDELKFKNGIASTKIKRDEFIQTTLNKIYLKSGEITSNEHYFTLFEYRDDMDDEEIEELYQLENKKPDPPIEEAREKYITSRNTHIGSIALGMFTAGIIVIFIGIIFDIVRIAYLTN